MRPKTYEYGNGKKASLYHQTLGIANDSEHGLAGVVYSKDAERAKKVALAIETGQIFINQPSSAHPELPFGGIKNSGFGREMSDIGLFEFANEKIVVD
ncbi:MAG: aldehyde dehydrogenase family protein [Ligilactobacillus ruminis]|nr:aldehyde dehydrogenase family protein [Ligilactobacillus ruminis]